MKKIKGIVAVLLMGLLVTKECAVAQAAEVGVTIESQGLETRELSQAEKNALIGEVTVESAGKDVQSEVGRSSSYTAYEYSEIFDISVGGTKVAEIHASCIVWHYTDGKVHLYSRSISVYRRATYDAARTYGSIVNTDGSLSYTTGDRVYIYGDLDVWEFAVDFRVTPTDAYFSCYEV